MKQGWKFGILFAVITASSVGGWFLYQWYEETGSYNFTDTVGRRVLVPNHPERIVSMAPSITEILFALEVQDRVVGRTDYCDYPTEAASIQSIGGFYTPNLEVLVSLDPDLIIAAANNVDKIQTLESYGFAVVIMVASNVTATISNIEIVGNLVDGQVKAKEVTGAMTAKLNGIKAKTDGLTEGQRTRCYYECWYSPKVAGGSSFIHDMLTIAGGNNSFGYIAKEWPGISEDAVIGADPEVILYTTMGMGAAYKAPNHVDRANIHVVAAITADPDKVYECPSYFDRPGPRVVDAVEQMAKYLQPSLFP